jgi:hypothetical protein
VTAVWLLLGWGGGGAVGVAVVEGAVEVED